MVLDKLAVDTPEVCIMYSHIETNLPNFGNEVWDHGILQALR